MGLELAASLSPHVVGRAQIDEWRGRCLDFFARGERLIGSTLESMRSASGEAAGIKLRHLAGQRADDLAKSLAGSSLTSKQKAAVTTALAGWRALEEQRNFLAHAALTVTLDQKGAWFAVFDMTVYRLNEPYPKRWVLTQVEAETFAAKLEHRGKSLGGPLGHLRKKRDAPEA